MISVSCLEPFGQPFCVCSLWKIFLVDFAESNHGSSNFSGEAVYNFDRASTLTIFSYKLLGYCSYPFEGGFRYPTPDFTALFSVFKPTEMTSTFCDGDRDPSACLSLRIVWSGNESDDGVILCANGEIWNCDTGQRMIAACVLIVFKRTGERPDGRSASSLRNQDMINIDEFGRFEFQDIRMNLEEVSILKSFQCVEM